MSGRTACPYWIEVCTEWNCFQSPPDGRTLQKRQLSSLFYLSKCWALSNIGDPELIWFSSFLIIVPTPPPPLSHTTTPPYNFWVLGPSPRVGESFIPGGGLIQNEMRKIKKKLSVFLSISASPKSHALKSWWERTRLIYGFQSTAEWRAPIRNHYLSTGVSLLFWQPAIICRLIQRPSC